MIAFVACVLLLMVFFAGHFFALHVVGATVILGLAFASFGLILAAAAQTLGFEGVYVPLPTGVTWGTVSKRLFIVNENKARFFNDDKLYVQTPTGPVAVTGFFTARINHEMSIVLDTSVEDAAHTFNALKQGVM